MLGRNEVLGYDNYCPEMLTGKVSNPLTIKLYIKISEAALSKLSLH